MAEEVVERVGIDVTGAIEALSGLDGAVGKTAKTIDKFMGVVGEAGLASSKAGGNFAATTTKIIAIGTAVVAAIAVFKMLAKTIRDVAVSGFDFLMARFVAYEAIILKIKSLTNTTTESLQKLSDHIREIAKASVFTSIEVGTASQALSKMGVAAVEQAEVLQMVTATAIGTQESLVKVTTLATKTMNMFQLQVSDMARINDVMAKSVSGSALDIQKLGDGLQYVGAVGNSVGLTLEETTAHIALLADRGQKANRAGRMLSNIYTEMANKGSKFNKFLEYNGVRLDTVKEKMDWLSKSDIDATTANAIFTKSVARMAVVVGTTGNDIDAMIESMENAEGTAKRMEKDQLSGLAAGWKIVKSLIEDTRIEIGEFLRPLGEAVVMGGKLNEWLTDGTKIAGGLQETFRVINTIVKTVLKSVGGFDLEMGLFANAIDVVMISLNGILKTVGTITIALVMMWKSATWALEVFGGAVVAVFVGIGKLAKGMWDSIWGRGSFKENASKAIRETLEATEIMFGEFNERYISSMKAGIDGIKELWVGKAPIEIEVTPKMTGFDAMKLAMSLKIPPDDKKKKKVKPPKLPDFSSWLLDMGTEVSFFEQMMGLTREMETEERLQTMLASVVDFGAQFINTALTVANTVSEIRRISYERDLKLLDKKEKSELKNLKMSSAAKQSIVNKYDKERSKMKKKQAEKDRKINIANALVNFGLGVAGIWANSFIAFKNPVVAAVMAGISTAMLTGVTVANIAKAKAQSFDGGGVVDGFNGATTGVDNRVANVRSGEMLLNAEQQRELFDIAKGSGGGGNRISVNIERYSGSDEDLGRLEDMLISLESHNRFNFGR